MPHTPHAPKRGAVRVGRTVPARLHGVVNLKRPRSLLMHSFCFLQQPLSACCLLLQNRAVQSLFAGLPVGLSSIPTLGQACFFGGVFGYIVFGRTNIVADLTPGKQPPFWQRCRIESHRARSCALTDGALLLTQRTPPPRPP